MSSGDIISPSTLANNCSFNGYLVDEDYFSSAGSSSTGNENNSDSDDSINQIGTITPNDEINGYRLFYTVQNKIFETDSLQILVNQLYQQSGGSSGGVKNLFIDEVNQDLYFLESYNSAADGTFIRKTSLSNFDPQTVYIIPHQYNDIKDFKVHPTTGEFYWSHGDAPQNGLYHYSDGNVIQDVSAYVYGIAFDSNGDLFYGQQSDLKNSSGETVYEAPTTIDGLEYNSSSDSFFMMCSDYIVDSNAGQIFSTNSATIQDISLNEITEEIMYVAGGVIGILDYNGDNHHVIDNNYNNFQGVEFK